MSRVGDVVVIARPARSAELWGRRELVWRIELRLLRTIEAGEDVSLADGLQLRRSLVDVDTGEVLDDVRCDERRRVELLVVELDDHGVIVDTGRRESRGRVVSQSSQMARTAESPHVRSSVSRPGTPGSDAERTVLAPHGRSAPVGSRRARRRSAGFRGRVVA